MTNVCLLEETTTAASAAALVFRRNHIDEEKPIVLDAKPSVSINNSILSQKYLAWGCYHHAHSCSYSEESVIESGNWKKKVGCSVRVVYECHVKDSLRRDLEMKEFFDNYEALDLLQCERALVGGRTEVFRVYANCDGRVGHYLDVVSLYPTVMKHEAYPIGEPENVQRNTMKTPMTKPADIPFEGFLSCRLNAPKNLNLPVIAGKKCAKDGNQDDCQHSDDERSFTGTFTTVELKKALSLGYWITQVYHGVKYEKWIRMEMMERVDSLHHTLTYSSGWPKNVQSEEDKKAFVAGYKEKEAITLDPSLFESNAGKRAVAKLMLNSLWGKFAQRVDRQKHCYHCGSWKNSGSSSTILA
ncbi:hypothetical protein B9Z55_028854 [Caenorhabditis nigoni]|uniref:DNA-directed DNA polymerase n=1 Tax=Caenorhabditis nigoni TaxID=1611254 RepID=A0A2G5SA84_9PELO|nr:hypothetical protein B9Z55_028854 [Caenorhabditis nigoni]